ncbi:MAG TPA: hypothetical protein VFU88_10575 [Ktedonobacterales bacterium]|nr:hypothetical protein [Ktedonobacterales bacterium]
MPKATTASSNYRTTSRPSPWSLLFHIQKTFSLVGAVLADARVHWLQKSLFVGTLGALLAALLIPELGVDLMALVSGIGIPLDILGLPPEATFDWIAFSVASYNLLKLFPAEIVGEHYDRLFRANRSNAA